MSTPSEINVVDLLSACWRVSMRDPEGGALANVPPPALTLKTTVAKTRMTVAGEGFSLEGDLTELPTYSERVWWKLGWANLRFVELLNSYTATVFLELALEAARPLAGDQLSPLIDGQGIDKDDVMIAKIFGGKRRASRKALITNTLAAYLNDPRPLQRRKALLSCAEDVAGASREQTGTSVEAMTRPALVALDDQAACVREAALVLCEWVGRVLVEQGDYAAALPYLDIGVSRGPSFAAQHARRFRARLALAREDADDDWRVFAAAVEKLAAVSSDPEQFKRALRLYRTDALVEAALTCALQETGLPTNEERRLAWQAFYKKSPWRAPKATTPSLAARQRFADARRAFAAEALERLSTERPATEREDADLFTNVLPVETLTSFDPGPLLSRLRSLSKKSAITSLVGAERRARAAALRR